MCGLERNLRSVLYFLKNKRKKNLPWKLFSALIFPVRHTLRQAMSWHDLSMFYTGTGHATWETGFFSAGHCRCHTSKICFVGGHNLCISTVLDPFFLFEVIKNMTFLLWVSCRVCRIRSRNWRTRQKQTALGEKKSKQKGHKSNLFLLSRAAAIKCWVRRAVCEAKGYRLCPASAKNCYRKELNKPWHTAAKSLICLFKETKSF